MELLEAIKLALQSLWQNKMRTVLTLLGMTIGVSSIIAVVTLVNGANTYVTTNFPATARTSSRSRGCPRSSPVRTHT